ncbi:RDD family protein [Salinibacterium sp. ZJ70]|uniref:RDD family protein n=1 Tax=Salinibacterium sp. ZJ70 TaxID=2708084 RepID=UPI001422B03E|nr:RDD family protein [Salinibacterium sp. ZJ70]
MSSAPETQPESRWPGERLGLPAAGPRSVARFGRRLAALAIDWAPAYFLSWSFFPTPNGADPFINLAIFAVLQYVFLITLNGSLGHIVMRMRVVPVAGGYLGFWRPAVRTLLLCLVIPALIWDVDQRGLHDKIAGTVLVRV